MEAAPPGADPISPGADPISSAVSPARSSIIAPAQRSASSTFKYARDGASIGCCSKSG